MNEKHYMKYSYTHIYIFLHLNFPNKFSARESSNMVGRLKNVLESVDAVEAILATYTYLHLNFFIN